MTKLTTVFQRFSRKDGLDGIAEDSHNVTPRNETGFVANEIPRNSDEPEADALLRPGEMSFEQATAGGLGRHLGLFSTTFLMYVLATNLALLRQIGILAWMTADSFVASVVSLELESSAPLLALQQVWAASVLR
jgi:hypothetical protein